MIQSKLYVFGGMNVAAKCLDDLWVFDLNTEGWKELTPVNKPPDLSDFGPCMCSAASTPGQLLVTVTCDMHNYYGANSCKYHLTMKTWMFIVHLKLWHLIDFTQGNDNDKHRYSIENGIVYWKGFLLMYHSYEVNIKYLAVRCPAGFTSSNISDQPCTFCKKGFYRETIFSDSDCFACPNGLTTINVGARNITECTVCDVNPCKYGKCVPNFSENTLRPVCQCYVGYTGSACQYPTYYLIVAGLILFAVFVSAGVTAYLLMLKRKTLNERALRREVVALTDVWQIDENEMTSQEMIGCGASGSVYKALYRDITVAVKKMVAVGFPKSIEDFETEIMFMRTVRHKNIVLFIGAGKSQPGDVPFLVMEYMERGSLRNVLYDVSIDINHERKNAMDSARGMHFLHTLEPPRIHRDLKSDNLLVSKHWIVKVADFGLGRAVTNDLRRNDRQKIERQSSSDPGHIPLIPLLSKRGNLSFAGVGTARWRAPELTLRRAYHTAVDVYSYGIVLWETWTRQLPFDQYNFDYEVTDAVIDKERPEIPRDCSQPLAMIMKKCWSSEPSNRPTFGQVILQLQTL
ncbi:probable serine/threonine-protein kinase drkC [Corticium candelabrum]|uniref:probable serine/threonine-protein kinase drkC n=1 Tax=Corticium candelabrum TaxID=121492 RepID=UPI002E25DEE6|nr:probable serine/threonine-protein kinase drkC [Corticium candelabrum]